LVAVEEEEDKAAAAELVELIFNQTIHYLRQQFQFQLVVVEEDQQVLVDQDQEVVLDQ
jgi:hypothetical protein